MYIYTFWVLAFVLALCRWRVCSFLLSLSLDKALHSAGISSGFIIFGTNLTNPLNELLLVLQPVSVFSSFMMKRWLSLIKMRSKSYFLSPSVINLNEAQCWSTFFFSWLPLNALVILSSKWESEREKKKKSKRVRTWTHCRWALKNILSKKQRHRVNESSCQIWVIWQLLSLGSSLMSATGILPTLEKQ